MIMPFTTNQLRLKVQNKMNCVICPWCYTTNIENEEFGPNVGRPIHVYQYITIKDEVFEAISGKDEVLYPSNTVIPCPCPNCRSKYYLKIHGNKVYTSRYKCELT